MNISLNTIQIKIQYIKKKISILIVGNFLHEAYKFESLNQDLSYVKAWVKNELQNY